MQTLKRTFSRNTAVLYGVAAKILNGISWLFAAAAVTTFMSPSTQGYFFTFLSFSTIQMLCDLGLGMAVIQFAAHEWGGLSGACRDDEQGSPASRLRSVLSFSAVWYLSGAVVLFALLALLGRAFFKGAPASVWPGAWMMLCVTVALDFSLQGFWNVLEGCNQVRSVYRYRALKALVLGGGVIVAIVHGAGLYALGIGYLLTLPLSIGGLLGRNARILRWIWTRKKGEAVSWRNEIMPLQWRLAVSFTSSYFAQWGITPLTLKLFGPAIAGQFGMIWSIINAVTAMASVIISVRAPQFGMLIAGGKFVELDRLALRISLLSVSVGMMGCLLIAVGIYALNIAGSSYATRVLPLGPSLVMLAGASLWQITSPLAVYLRSHKKEPYLWLSFSFAIGLFGAAFVAGHLLGAYGVAFAYLILVACFFVPISSIIFVRCRRLWHSEGAMSNI